MPTGNLDDKAIFNATRRIDSADARREYLRHACVEDHAQLERVTALLRGFEKDSQFLESPIVDTRSDIYSLGVLLYQLLTGSTPFDRETMKRVGFDEWRRIIREDEPRRPSTMVSTFQAKALSTVATQRGCDPHRLCHSLTGELDWIVMRALEKDRARRYETANGLAVDIERYLGDEPVRAGPPSRIYRLRKLARRNKTVIAAVALVMVAMIVATAISSWQALEALDARKLADTRLADSRTLRQRAERSATEARASEAFARQLVYASDVRLAAQAWDAGDLRHYSDLLDHHRPAAGKRDLRGFEWRYLRQLGTAVSRTIAASTEGQCCVRYSPDGKFIAAGRGDGTICVWDALGYRQLATWRGHEDLVRCIDFSPDGKRMASIGDDCMIRLWDVESLTEIRNFKAFEGGIGQCVYFAMAGKLLIAIGEETKARTWDVDSGKLVDTVEVDGEETRALAVSPDGKSCVVGGYDSKHRIWDLGSHQHVAWIQFPGYKEAARCLRYSPDGSMIAAGTDDNFVRLCDVRTGEVIASFEGHGDDIQHITFHPSGGMLASCDRAGVIRTWMVPDATATDQTSALGNWLSTTSAPGPPRSRSLPSCPNSMSLPDPPYSESTSGPPARTSSPSPP